MVEFYLLPVFTLHILHQLVAPTTSTENIRISPEFGALDCYPCYCKLGVKFNNGYSDRCSECPICNTHGHMNKSKEIPTDEFHGAFDCYPCICDPGYFGNALTHYQCTECLDCHGQNKQFKTNCTQDTDSECGDCLKGYTKSWMEHAACVKIEKKTTVTPKLSSTPGDTYLPPIVGNGHAKKSQTILVVILVISTFSAFCIIFLGYYVIKHSSCCSKDYYNVTASTSAATLAQSKSSVNKNDYQTTQLNGGSTQTIVNALLPESTDLEQCENPHLECDGLLTGDQPQNVRRMSDDKNVYIFYQKGDCNSVHIDALPSLQS
ncbi:uncharacterized protein LOC143085075 isoform X3 [Mytilus galloprovincialis]|uniref:uncharacterized protein LOC143085075 isoform X3 n=1 Tax=Mytilus galloprovincialis TaxID=29158 RepID=UPI003F7C229D